MAQLLLTKKCDGNLDPFSVHLLKLLEADILNCCDRSCEIYGRLREEGAVVVTSMNRDENGKLCGDVV